MKFYAPFRSMFKVCIARSYLIALVLLFIISGSFTNVFAKSTGNNITVAHSYIFSDKYSATSFLVRGTVLDENRKPLPGVNVKLRGTKFGTTTDLDGNFKLTVPNGGGTLDFSFIGYDNYSVSVSSAKVVTVQLKPSARALDVVEIAYAVQKKVNVTGAVSTVKPEELVSASVSNITNALVGTAPGVSSLQTSGEPGRNSASINIRGISTYGGSSSPLYVIDGIEQPAEQATVQLNSIDPNEIASISILKDAASTAVYGIRAANGVIIVTTKRGKTGKAAISFSANYGLTHATSLMKTVNSYDYAVFRNQAVNIYANDFNNLSFNNLLFTDTDLWKFKNNRDYTPEEVAAMTNLTDAQKAQLNASPALYYTSHDLYQQEFGNTGPQHQYNLNVRGGTDKVRYFTSLGYFNQGSILNNTSFAGSSTASTYDRYNFRSNFDIQPTKNLTVSVNIAGQFSTTSGPSAVYGNPFDNNARYKGLLQYIQEGNPFVVPGILDNRLITNIAGVPGSPDNPLGIKGTTATVASPVAILLTSGQGIVNNTLLSNSIIVSHQMDYLTKGLSVHGTANYDDDYSKYITINPAIPSYTVRRDGSNPNNLLFFGGALSPTNFISYSNGNNTVTWHKIYFDASVNYARTFGAHSVSALILGKAQQYVMPSDVFNTPSGLMGFAGRLNYNYKEKYLLEYDLGYNGTENFAPGKRFGFFPAYSAGWVLTNESFMKRAKWLSFLKIRGSYGEVGNDQIYGRRYLYLPSTYNQNQGPYYLGNSNGSVPNPAYPGTTEGALGNPDVTWEKAQKYDIGVDAWFMDSKLQTTLEVFKENRNNILTTLGTIPVTFGVAGNNIPPVNVGKTTNHGYEISLLWTDKINQLGYSIRSSVSYARNKIIYRAEAPNPYSWENATGKSIGQYFGLVSDGFFNTPQELANRPYNTFNSNQNTLGDIRYKDINGDGKIDVHDRVPIGYPNLPEYAFNTRVSLNYKHFDFSVLFNGTAEGAFYLNSNITTVFFKNFGMAYQWQYDGRWTPEKVANGTPITYPRPELNATSANSNFLTSDFWLKSNNFIKVKTIELGYSLPSDLLKHVNISNLRVYVNGNNVFIFKNQLTKYGIDPETTDNGTAYIFPITRVINFGASVRF